MLVNDGERLEQAREGAESRRVSTLTLARLVLRSRQRREKDGKWSTSRLVIPVKVESPERRFFTRGLNELSQSLRKPSARSYAISGDEAYDGWIADSWT